MVRSKPCTRISLTAFAVFYETAGTIGPITAVKLIDSVGENLSFFLSPISLALAGIAWSFIRLTESQQEVIAQPADPAVEKAIPHTPVKKLGYLKGYIKAPYSTQDGADSSPDSHDMSPFGDVRLGMEVPLCLASAASSGLSPATHLHFLRTGMIIAL